MAATGSTPLPWHRSQFLDKAAPVVQIRGMNPGQTRIGTLILKNAFYKAASLIGVDLGLVLLDAVHHGRNDRVRALLLFGGNKDAREAIPAALKMAARYGNAPLVNFFESGLYCGFFRTVPS